MKDKKGRKYEYHFVNGEKIVINLNIHVEGDFDWLKLLQELDRQEYNNEHTETRRHCSLEIYDKDERLESKEPDILEQILWKESIRLLTEELTAFEREVFHYFFVCGYIQCEISRLLGVERTKVTRTIRRIREKVTNKKNI